jgi:hypothetical protein
VGRRPSRCQPPAGPLDELRVALRLGEPLRLEEHLEIVGADGDEPGEQELVEGFGLVVGTARSPLPVDNFTVRLGVEIGR